MDKWLTKCLFTGSIILAAYLQSWAGDYRPSANNILASTPTFTTPVTFNQDVQATGSTVTFSASQTINWQTQGPRAMIVLTGNITSSTWSNAAQRGIYTLILVQGGSGSYTVSWPSGMVWPSKGSAPTLSTAVGARDYFSILYDVDGSYHVLAEALNN